MAQSNTASDNDFGWFGWFSAAGFVILGLLYVVDVLAFNWWPYSTFWTGVVALVAGIGAAALYAGNDPTDDTDRETTV
ncbi:hypothetical protein ACFQE8_20400 [Salinirubellus sp. GCM10025818]|uniref:hypothetical protein n=1 Tax=Salinirubellus TaxID=2162630 RepID=UPI0030CC2397